MNACLLSILALSFLAPQQPRAVDARLEAPRFAQEAAVVLDDVALQDRLSEHRMAEARRKVRLARLLSEVEAQRTANQDDYDVTHYFIDLTLSPAQRRLTGTVTVTADVVGATLSTMELNLDDNLSMTAATSGGGAASYTHGGDLVTVTLDRTYANGETVVVSVSYQGDPEGGAFGWDSHAGQTMIWTLSEPFGAREWWPCKDVNTDKPDAVDIRVDVSSNLIVASNGRLLSDTPSGNRRVFHWRTDYPIATYLVSLAIYPYQQFSHWYTPLAGGGPMEVQYFVYPDHYSSVQSTYALVVPMLQAFASAYGEYPFVDEKYGHAEFEWGGGMEHQTISSLGGYSEDLISHELAHQWYGDQITCADFGHIWLNEGFATWSEAYWKETTAGPATYQSYMDAAAFYGGGTIFVEDTSNFSSIFDVNLTYNKASWVVHMLRGVLGDTDFFAGLAEYRTQYGYGAATTEQFRDCMEAASGVDLDAFFDDWIYGEYYPEYELDWTQNGSTLDLTIDQVQTGADTFTLPIDVRVTTTLGVQDFVVQNSQWTQAYQLAVTGQVQDVELDPDKWILKQISTTVTNPTFDQGILLVNGVDWATYGSELTNAYEANAFWGSHPIAFWDCFTEPSGGYPSTLPDPIGNDAVPASVIGQYSTVIWVGNNYNGDLADWQTTPIDSYLSVGGNVLLMTRWASSFLDSELMTYLGVTWSSTGTYLYDYSAQVPGLIDVPLTGTQSYNDVFATSVGPRSTLLFRDETSSNRGVGVHASPPIGTGIRPEGGQFVLLGGRPYRMGHAELRTNVEAILSNWFQEPYTPPRAGPRKSRTDRRPVPAF